MTPSRIFVALLLAMLFAPTALLADSSVAGHHEAVEVEFRGCDLAGWCSFQAMSSIQPGESLLRVRPEGVVASGDDQPIGFALRNRLNALLANMIHQAKRIELRDVRDLGDGIFAAVVTVHGVDVASDPVIQELRTKKIRRPRPPD